MGLSVKWIFHHHFLSACQIRPTIYYLLVTAAINFLIHNELINLSKCWLCTYYLQSEKYFAMIIFCFSSKSINSQEVWLYNFLSSYCFSLIFWWFRNYITGMAELAVRSKHNPPVNSDHWKYIFYTLQILQVTFTSISSHFLSLSA